MDDLKKMVAAFGTHLFSMGRVRRFFFILLSCLCAFFLALKFLQAIFGPNIPHWLLEFFVFGSICVSLTLAWQFSTAPPIPDDREPPRGPLSDVWFEKHFPVLWLRLPPNVRLIFFSGFVAFTSYIVAIVLSFGFSVGILQLESIPFALFLLLWAVTGTLIWYGVWPLLPTASAVELSPPAKVLEKRLWQTIADRNLPVPPKPLQDLILKAGEDVYQSVVIPTDRDEKWEKAEEKLFEAISQSMAAYLIALPQFEPGPFTLPLTDVVDTPRVINGMLKPFYGLPFPVELKTTFHDRTVEITKRDPKATQLVYPNLYVGTPQQVVSEYLSGTPYADLFDIRTPYALPESVRKAHTVIVAGSDRGKTQMLEAMTWSDLQDPNPPGMVIIDSKGDMVKRIAKLDVFNPDNGRLKDKLIIIDPRDGPSLAPFDIGIHELEAADPEHVEEVVNGIISEMGYLFRSLLGDAITGPMSGVFNPLVQLMVRVPKATLETLTDAIQDPIPYIKEAPGLPDAVHKFLTTRYKDLMPRETKTAVERRVHSLLVNSPSIGRIFGGSKNRLDLTKALIEGATLLVSTETTFLNEFSPVFGRYLISQTMLAARKRPKSQRKQAYLIVDEAGAYFDDRTEVLLRTLREYGLGGVLAFQDWAQAPALLKAAIISSTSIKMVGSDSEADARALAGDMKTEPEFILAQGKVDRQHGDFACYVRGVTPKAISIRVPFGTLDTQDQMTDEQYKRMRANNKASLTNPGDSTSQTSQRTRPSPAPYDPGDTAPSTDWKK